MNKDIKFTINKMALVKLSLVVIVIAILSTSLYKLGAFRTYEIQYVIDKELHTEVYDTYSEYSDRLLEVIKQGATIY